MIEYAELPIDWQFAAPPAAYALGSFWQIVPFAMSQKVGLTHHIPFIGGEPTYAEQTTALAHKGYMIEDVTFAVLSRSLEQSIAAARLSARRTLVLRVRTNFQGRSACLGSQFMNYVQFSSRDVAMCGVDTGSDTKFTERSDPGKLKRAAIILSSAPDLVRVYPTVEIVVAVSIAALSPSMRH